MRPLPKRRGPPGGLGVSHVQAAHGAVVDHLQVDAVSHELPDVLDAVFDHGGAGGDGMRGGSVGGGPQRGVSPHKVTPTHRSRESPQAMTVTFSGSPMGSSISGRKIPEFPTSTHFFNPGEGGVNEDETPHPKY